MHRHEHRPPATPVAERIANGASWTATGAVVVIWLGARLISGDVLSGWWRVLALPLVVAGAAALSVATLAGAATRVRDGQPLGLSRAAVNAGAALFFIGQLGTWTALWGEEAGFAMGLWAVALIGAALLGDAVRDARRAVYPRLAVISAALGGVGMLLLAAAELFGRSGDVWNRAFWLSAVLIGAAGYGVLKLRRVATARSAMLDRMGLGPR